jgi:hypothetical protein
MDPKIATKGGPVTWYQALGTKHSVPNAWYKALLGTNRPNTLYQVPGTEYMVASTWCQVPGTHYLVPSAWSQILGTQHLVFFKPSSWYQVLVRGTVLGTKCPAPNTLWPIFGARYLVPSTWYQRLGIKNTNYLVQNTWYRPT